MDDYDYRQIMNSNTLLKPMIKSQYRGVYRCGKKWKAQMQSNGVQFYLGIYETELEAAQAYEKKVKESGGNARLKSAPGGRRYDGGSIHFESKSESGNIDLAQVFMLQHQQHRSYHNHNHNHSSPSQSVIAKEREDEEGDDSMTTKPFNISDNRSTSNSEKANHISTKHHHQQQQQQHTTSTSVIQPSGKTNTEYQHHHQHRTEDTTPTNLIDNSNNNNGGGPLLRLMWERFCQISQRIIVAKSSQQLLQQLSDGDPSDPEKKQLLAALDEEVGMLATVKGQLEEAVSRCFARDVTMKATVASAVPPVNTTQPTGVVHSTREIITSTNNSNSSSSSSSSEGEQSVRPDQKARRTYKSSIVHQPPPPPAAAAASESYNDNNNNFPPKHVLLVDAKMVQTLKRKAPEQLLAYRNRIGPVGKRTGPACAAVQSSSIATTTVEGDDDDDDDEAADDDDRGSGTGRARGKGGEQEDELTSAATTGLINLSTTRPPSTNRYPQLLPHTNGNANDDNSYHQHHHQHPLTAVRAAAIIDSSTSSASSIRGSSSSSSSSSSNEGGGGGGGGWRDSGIPSSSSSLQQQPKARK